MKDKFIILALSSLILVSSSCSNEDSSKRVEEQAHSSSDVQIPEQKKPILELSQFKDQYPSEVNLLDNPLIKGRLKTLLGSDYADFRKYWEVETPILMEENVLSTSGCEQHNCAANMFILQIDLKGNNLNVFRLGSKIKSYKEDGAIMLPPGLAKEFETIKENSL